MENFNVFWEEEGKKTQRETEKNQEKKIQRQNCFVMQKFFSDLVFSNTLMEYYLCNFANFPAKLVAMKVQ